MNHLASCLDLGTTRFPLGGKFLGAEEVRIGVGQRWGCALEGGGVLPTGGNADRLLSI